MSSSGQQNTSALNKQSSSSALSKGKGKADLRKAKSSNLEDKIIILETGVGDDTQRFNVSQRMLTSVSKYFEGDRKGNFNAKEGVIHLGHPKPEVVKAFTDWLYSSLTKNYRAFVDGQRQHNPMQLTFDLYALADYLLVEKLKNACIDYLVLRSTDRARFPIPVAESQDTWDQVAATDKLRVFMLDYYYTREPEEIDAFFGDERTKELVSKDFWLAYAKKVTGYIKVKDRVIPQHLTARCLRYHSHTCRGYACQWNEYGEVVFDQI